MQTVFSLYQTDKVNVNNEKNVIPISLKRKSRKHPADFFAYEIYLNIHLHERRNHP